MFKFNETHLSIDTLVLPLQKDIFHQFSHWLPIDLERSVPLRKEEFIAGRYCAFNGAKKMGVHLKELSRGPGRAPVWPSELRGSISHSRKLAISCVGLSSHYQSIGIDAEEVMSAKRANLIYDSISSKDEQELIGQNEFEKWLTLLFSAKESLYKALSPIVQDFIDFNEVELVGLNHDHCEFDLNLKSTNAKLGKYLGTYKGQFKIVGETIVTVVLIPKLS